MIWDGPSAVLSHGDEGRDWQIENNSIQKENILTDISHSTPHAGESQLSENFDEKST